MAERKISEGAGEVGVLRHIAFIMDGNGRWAQRRGQPRENGHRIGVKALESVASHCRDIGLSAVTVYAFSTENWKRPKKEVDTILGLLERYLDDCMKKKDSNQIHFRFLGDLSVFSPAFREKMKTIEESTAHFPITLSIALNYGGRAEITHAFSVLQAKGKTTITEDDITSALYTADLPPVDLIVRTGGDLRISNFLLWQAAYAELYFTDTLWPDFGPKDVDLAVEAFYSRKRRYGGV